MVGVTVGGVVTAGGTPTTVNPCDRTARMGKVLFVSNRLPVSPTANGFIRNNITRRARRSLGGMGTVLARTNCSFGSIIGAAMFLSSVTSFTTVGTICGRCCRARYPTHDTFTIGTLPVNTLIRVRAVTKLCLVRVSRPADGDPV